MVKNRDEGFSKISSYEHHVTHIAVYTLFGIVSLERDNPGRRTFWEDQRAGAEKKVAKVKIYAICIFGFLWSED